MKKVVKLDRNPFRLTYQRKIILEELKNLGNHPTVDDVYLSVKKKLPRISMSTVYRSLDVLAKNGFIKKLEPIDVQKRFDGNINEHFHFYCTNCGRVEDIILDGEKELEEALKKIQENLKKSGNYAVKGYTLEFFGICKNCKKDR